MNNAINSRCWKGGIIDKKSGCIDGDHLSEECLNEAFSNGDLIQLNRKRWDYGMEENGRPTK